LKKETALDESPRRPAAQRKNMTETAGGLFSLEKPAQAGNCRRNKSPVITMYNAAAQAPSACNQGRNSSSFFVSICAQNLILLGLTRALFELGFELSEFLLFEMLG
jgi:hypothetical protein